MSDQVTIAWTDDTGTYTSMFAIENPTLAEVKASAASPMMGMPPGAEAKVPSDEEFYANLSLQMVNQVLYQTQQRRQQQAMAAVPPVSVKTVDPPL